jgi:hypothetical protein
MRGEVLAKLIRGGIFMAEDDQDFDPSIYTRPPKLDVAAAVALTIALLAALPLKAPPAVKKAAQKLRKAIVKLQAVWRERDRLAKPSDPRLVDVMADRAMGRLHGRIDAYAGLPAEAYPLATRAQDILNSLFLRGLEFLKDDYASQWAETKKLLDRIDEENLAADIDKIAGPEFLAEVRRIHKLYGNAIGVTQSREKLPVPSLVQPLRDVNAAIAVYSVQLLAVVMDEEADKTLRAAARAALQPMDDYRAGVARREARRATEATPDTPVPEVPDTPGDQ